MSLHQNESVPSEGLASLVQMAQRFSLPSGYLFGGAGAYEEQKIANVVFFSQKV